MSKIIIKMVLGLVISAIAIWLALIWFGWKFLLVIGLLLWANNISQSWDRK